MRCNHEFLNNVHPDWYDLLSDALSQIDSDYLQQLSASSYYLPNKSALLNAFSEPLSNRKYILFGESPYPRSQSANGYAFWDAAVNLLWSSTGFSREVNRATSLRNLMKMLLFARGKLTDNFSQEYIGTLDHSIYHQTASSFFRGLLSRGFILLNASLVYEEKKIPYHAKMWRPFLGRLLQALKSEKPEIQLLLFGKIAEMIPEYKQFDCVIAEHPYNLSFITNPTVVHFFQPLDVLVP